MIQIHLKENSKIIWPFAHIPMCVVLGVKPMYIRDKGFKSWYGNFYMFLGMIKETSKDKNGLRGLRSLQRDRGRLYKV